MDDARSTARKLPSFISTTPSRTSDIGTNSWVDFVLERSASPGIGIKKGRAWVDVPAPSQFVRSAAG